MGFKFWLKYMCVIRLNCCFKFYLFEIFGSTIQNVKYHKYACSLCDYRSLPVQCVFRQKINNGLDRGNEYTIKREKYAFRIPSTMSLYPPPLPAAAPPLPFRMERRRVEMTRLTSATLPQRMEQRELRKLTLCVRACLRACVCVRACVRACVRVCVCVWFFFLLSLFVALYIFLHLTALYSQILGTG